MTFSYGLDSTSTTKITQGLNGTNITPVPTLHSKLKSSVALEKNESVLMPPEIRGLTLGFVDGDIVGQTKESPYLPESNKQYHFFNQTDLPVTALLNHVVRGEMQEVKILLDKNPSLVLYKGQVTDYSGRTIEGTAYQMALGAEDVSRKESFESGMAEIIRGYFFKAKEFKRNVKAANKEINDQFEKQFPREEFEEYYITDEKKREAITNEKNAKDPDIKALEEVAKAIRAADPNEIKRIPRGHNNQYGYPEYDLEVTGNCAKALQAFRDYLMPRSIIKKGKHFNAHLLLKAFEKYVGPQFDDFGGSWDNPKNLLFSRQVIGYIERYLPANFAQAFCQGLYSLTNRWRPLKRDLKLEDKSFFYPPVGSSSGLGVDRMVYCYSRGSTSGGQVAGRGSAVCYKAYVEQKQFSYSSSGTIANHHTLKPLK